MKNQFIMSVFVFRSQIEYSIRKYVATVYTISYVLTDISGNNPYVIYIYPCIIRVGAKII